MTTRVSIIIVNYRTPGQVFDCLCSLARQRNTFLDFNVWVVDNNSGDGSVPFLTEKVRKNSWSGWVLLIEQSVNKGFAGGNNAALKRIFQGADHPKFIMLLNPDTVIEDDAIVILSDFLDHHKEVGIVGAQLLDRKGCFESTARRYPTCISELISGARSGPVTKLLSKWQVALPVNGNAHQCDWVSGAAMMVRSSVFDEIGYLDEGFFLYYEELDFSKRAGKAGWQVWLEPASLVIHDEGQSTGIKNAVKRRTKHWFDSRRRYFLKHYGIAHWLSADLLWAVGKLIFFLRKFNDMKQFFSSDPKLFAWDLLAGDFLALLRPDTYKIKKST